MNSQKTIDLLARLATQHETKAAALRDVIADLSNGNHHAARVALPAKLRAATKVRAAARPTHAERMAARRVRVAAALTALAERPRTMGELVGDLQASHGGVNKWAALGWVKRGHGGVYTLTAKGTKRLAELQQDR
jgi:hypothetical protein